MDLGVEWSAYIFSFNKGMKKTELDCWAVPKQSIEVSRVAHSYIASASTEVKEKQFVRNYSRWTTT